MKHQKGGEGGGGEGFCVQSIHENNGENENDIEAVLATLCCYDHGAKASEAVQKVTTDQKKY